MENNNPVEGWYEVNGVRKEFSFEYKSDPSKQQDSANLLELMDNPMQLLRQGGAYGIQGAKKFLPVIGLFILANLIVCIYMLVQLLSGTYIPEKLLFGVLVVIVGIGFTAFAGYKVYRFMIIDTLRVIYQHSEGLFRKICSIIVDKADDVMKGKLDFSNPNVQQAINLTSLMQQYYSKMPKLLQRRFIKLLERIPMVKMMQPIGADIISGNKPRASALLYDNVNAFIMNSIFAANNFKWVYRLLLLNLLIQMLIIQFKIA
jgi:hypothetical protein